MESKLGKRVDSSTMVDDMKDYIKPLLPNKPSKIILHAATNDTADCSAEEIARKLLALKGEIESAPNGYEVILSLPIRRSDNTKANMNVQTINSEMFSLGLSIINNSNILNSDIGRSGLHLNQKGVTKLLSNIIGKLRSL